MKKEIPNQNTRQKSILTEIFSKRIGEMLEALDYMQVDQKLKDILRKSTWRIHDELEGKLNLNGKQHDNQQFRI